MKGLVETIAKSIVDHPDQVFVNEVEGEKSIILEVTVADNDMGKIIGKQGRIARAIRTVVKAAATKEGKKVIVDIQEND
ncbi:KH domain-containing protein [Natronospora cellulosivora (SeqCode)]